MYLVLARARPVGCAPLFCCAPGVAPVDVNRMVHGWMGELGLDWGEVCRSRLECGWGGPGMARGEACGSRLEYGGGGLELDRGVKRLDPWHSF